MCADNLRVKAVRGAGVNVAAQLGGLFLHIASVVALARLLTPKDFGMVSMVTAFSIWFMNFGLNGFTEYIIQKESLETDEISSIFWAHTLLASLLALIFSGFGYLLVRFYSEPKLWGISAAMSASFVLVAMYTCHIAVLKRAMRFASVAVVSLAASLISILLAIAAATTGMGHWAIVIRQLSLPSIMVIGAWIISPWRPSLPRRLTLARPGLKYAVQVYLNYSLRYLRQNADRVLLGKFGGSEILGHYDRANYLSSMPASQFLDPLHSVVLATLSRLTNDKKRFTAYFTNAVSMVANVGILASLVLSLTSVDLVRILLGPQWLFAGKIVMVFGPGVAGLIMYETNSWLHLSLGTPDRWLRWNVVASSLTIGAFALAAPHGAISMALAFSIITNLLVIPALWYAGRPLGLRLRTLIAPVWSYYASAVLVAFVWISASTSWPPLKSLLIQLTPITRVLAVGSIASLFYVLLVIAFERSFRSVHEVISFAEILFRRRKK